MGETDSEGATGRGEPVVPEGAGVPDVPEGAGVPVGSAESFRSPDPGAVGASPDPPGSVGSVDLGVSGDEGGREVGPPSSVVRDGIGVLKGAGGSGGTLVLNGLGASSRVGSPLVPGEADGSPGVTFGDGPPVDDRRPSSTVADADGDEDDEDVRVAGAAG